MIDRAEYASFAKRRASAWRSAARATTTQEAADGGPASSRPPSRSRLRPSGMGEEESRRREEEPTDRSLRDQYRNLEAAFLRGLERDRSDVERCLEREREFTVEYLRMSTNRVWAAEAGPPVAVYAATAEEYKGEGGKHEIWPRGRRLEELWVFGQIWDFFRFMWDHTRPYKTVAMILLMSLVRPFQVAALGYITQLVEQDPQSVTLWLYLFPFYGEAAERLMYWWHEMWVPLNSQRVQLRSVLLSRRMRLPDAHPLAAKWPPGRFNGLLKDVDDVVNGIWANCLNMFDKMVSMAYLLVLCFLNLASALEEELEAIDYGIYVAVFLGLGAFIMGLPFLWFYLFQRTVQECETMVRDGQALYMSVASDAIAMGVEEALFEGGGGSCTDVEKGGTDGPREQPFDVDCGGEGTARKAFRVYGLTTFRAFFHRLAWTSNYNLLNKVLGSLVAYGLLTAEDFGDKLNLASTLIVLIALRDLTAMSTKLLDLLVTMSRGCNVLVDVAELLNADVLVPVGSEAGDNIVEEIEEGGEKMRNEAKSHEGRKGNVHIDMPRVEMDEKKEDGQEPAGG